MIAAEVYNMAVALWQRKDLSDEGTLYAELVSHDIGASYHFGEDNTEIEPSLPGAETGRLRLAHEKRNALNAASVFAKALHDKEPLSFDLILKMHKALTEGTYDSERLARGERPGTLKKHEYTPDPDNDTVGSSVEDAKDELLELIDEVQDFPKDKVLTAAAYFHAKFENIHPFADGNGRTGRLAMNYLLTLNGHPPLTINILNHDIYLAGLNEWNTKQEFNILKNLFARETVRTWAQDVVQEKNMFIVLDTSKGMPGEAKQARSLSSRKDDSNYQGL